MSLYLTNMFALPFKHLIDRGGALFPNVSPPSHATDDAGTPLSLAKILCTVLEGQVHRHVKSQVVAKPASRTPLYDLHQSWSQPETIWSYRLPL